MQKNDKDVWQDLFAAIPDEDLPEDFTINVMRKVRQAAVSHAKNRRLLAIFGYGSGIAVMLATCVIAFYYMDISFRLPVFNPSVWSFPKPDFSIFDTPSFSLSFQLGITALFLLIIDSTIRRRIEKSRNKD